MASQIIDTKTARVNRTRPQTVDCKLAPVSSGFVPELRDQIWYRWWHCRQKTRAIRHLMRIDGPDARERVEQALREQVAFILGRITEPCI